MGMKFKQEALVKFAGKYKYVLVIIIVGVLLMLIPGKSGAEEEISVDQRVVTNSDSVEEKLEELLSKVHGAGEVHVLLTDLSGEEIVYQTDDRGTGDNANTDTVIVTDSNRNQAGLIQQRNPPVYRGAVIVCDGADDPQVRLALTDAVKNATGLRSDQISVLKMK